MQVRDNQRVKLAIINESNFTIWGVGKGLCYWVGKCRCYLIYVKIIYIIPEAEQPWS